MLLPNLLWQNGLAGLRTSGHPRGFASTGEEWAAGVGEGPEGPSGRSARELCLGTTWSHGLGSGPQAPREEAGHDLEPWKLCSGGGALWENHGVILGVLGWNLPLACSGGSQWGARGILGRLCSCGWLERGENPSGSPVTHVFSDPQLLSADP